MIVFQTIAVAFGMFSALPVPRFEWDSRNMRYALCAFPLVGLACGGLWCLCGAACGALGLPGPVQDAAYCLVPVAVTGGIHLDGYADTADALASYGSREKKLEILKDSHAGAFAILMGCCYFVLDYGVFHATDLRAIRLLAIGYVLSRAFSGLAIVVFKKARKSGLAATFSDSAQKKTVAVTMILYIAACAVLMVLTDPVIGSLCFLTALLVFGWYRYMSYQKFGGITGDLAGFFLQVCELAMAFVTVIAIHLIG